MTTFAPRLHDDPPRFVTSRLLEDHGLPHLFTTRHFPGVVKPTEPRPPFGPEAAPLLAPRGLGAPARLREAGPRRRRPARGAGRARGPRRCPGDGPPRAAAGHLHRRLPAHRALRRARRAAGRGARGMAGHRAVGGPRRRRRPGRGGERGRRPGGRDRPVHRPLLLRGGCPGDRAVPGGVPGRLGAVDDAEGAGKVDARPLAGQPGPAHRPPGSGPDRVDSLGLCTGCRPDLLFSYRRERGAGRLVTVAALPERAC